MNASYKTAIKFKDLYIPVKMIKVSHNNSIELNQLCKDSKERVRYIKFCPSCNKEIHNEDIVKGYRYAEDKYVILEQSDIDSITTDQDRMLSIEYFCKSKEISELLIDKSYYLIPEMESEISYELLRKAMITNRVVAVTKIVLGTKQELVLLFPNKNCIIATILFYENEINELPPIMKHKTDKQQLENLKETILNNTKEFDWNSHYDKYQLKLRKLIFNKIPK
jgi:DNA end-binding protein Ku